MTTAEVSSAGKPVENQQETSTLPELRSRLERMASNTHVEELLQILSAAEEWQRNRGHQNRDAVLRAATNLAAKPKDRDPADVAQEMEAKIKSRGIELSNLVSSAGKPVENQHETSTLFSLRARLERMASNRHLEDLLEILSAVEECQRNPSNQSRQAFIQSGSVGAEDEDATWELRTIQAALENLLVLDSVQVGLTISLPACMQGSRHVAELIMETAEKNDPF